MTQNDRPSSFVDSPEDLLRKARILVESGRLDPQVAVLFNDIVRELAKSRENHARRMTMVAAQAAETEAVRESARRPIRIAYCVSIVASLVTLANVIALFGHR